MVLCTINGLPYVNACGVLGVRAGVQVSRRKLHTHRVSLIKFFVKVHNEKVHFQKAECLVKDVKKCFLKKLSVWLALIKVVV